MKTLSYQLYSSRNFMPLDDVLKRVAAAGYSQVEGYGALYASLDDLNGLKGQLDANGLHMASGHFGLDMLEDDVDTVLKIANTLDVKAVYCPFLMPDARPTDAAGWKAFGEKLQAVGAPYRDAGLIFGWHNHDFEFVPCSDGTVPQAAMFDGGPDLSWEADIAWVIRGGGDPLEWIKNYGDRISAVHVKDIAPEGECLDEDGWADVGHGVVDWAGLLTALKDTNAEIFVMEHDNPSDDTRFATRSFNAVAAM